MTKPYTIVNMIARAVFNCQFDLDRICLEFPSSTVGYDPESFPGLIYRTKEPKYTSLIFKSGKMICPGDKSEEEAKKHVNRVIQDLKKYNIPLDENPQVDTVNIVASGKLPYEVDFEKIPYALTKVIYEPQMFPGIIHDIDDPKVTVLIFSNSKIVIAGAKKETDLDRAFEKLCQELKSKNIFVIPPIST